jgi:hypothetical protein
MSVQSPTLVKGLLFSTLRPPLLAIVFSVGCSGFEQAG